MLQRTLSIYFLMTVCFAGAAVETPVLSQNNAGAALAADNSELRTSILAAMKRRDRAFGNLAIETKARVVNRKLDQNGIPGGEIIGPAELARDYNLTRLGYAYKMEVTDLDPATHALRFDGKMAYDPVAGISRSYVTHPQLKNPRGLIDSKDDGVVRFNPFFRYIGSGRGEELQSPHEFILAHPDAIHSIEKDAESGQVILQMIMPVTKDGPEIRNTYRLDPEHDYFIVRADYEQKFSNKDGSVLNVKNVFASTGGFVNLDGVVLPHTISWWIEASNNQPKDSLYVTEGEFIRGHANDVRAEEVQLQFPDGTDIGDALKGISYIYNDSATDAKRVQSVPDHAIPPDSSNKPLVSATSSALPVAGIPSADRPQAAFTRDSQWWWLAVAGGISVLAGVALLWKFWSNKRRAA